MSDQSRLTALKIACYVVIAFGLLMSASVFTPLGALMRHFLDLAFLPFDGIESFAGAETRLLTAVLGGIMAGWGLMMLRVTTRLYAADATVGRAIILPGMLTWFVIDSAGSILVGAWFNAVMNTGFLLLFAVPILWRAPDVRTSVRSG